MQRTNIVVGEFDASRPVYRAPVITVETADEPRAGSSISIKVPLQRLHFPCIMPTALYPSPQAHANPRLTSVGKLHASGFENLTQAGDGTGSYFIASLEANDCLGSHPGGNR